MKIPFCLIPAGSFVRENHLVTLTRDFWMASEPITQGSWTRIVGSNPSRFRKAGSDAPVENVSWEDAAQFLAMAGHGLRLPTEAEWEYACRAGTAGPYNVETRPLEDLGWFADNSGGTTHPVGRKLPNAWGLHDMHGNVREWCLDSYGGYPNSDSVDPKSSGPSTIRVLRGGSWIDDRWYCRSARRDGRHSGFQLGFIGFRPIRYA